MPTRKLAKKLWSDLHRSYFVIWWCIGIIAGVVLGLVFKINYFTSAWWCVLAAILMLFAFIKPNYTFIIIAFLSGMIVAFFRVTGTVATMSIGVDDSITTMRDFFAERIRAQIAEPEVSLGLSYLLGMKTGLPKALSENLKTVGLTHIVVASGAHLSILVEVAKKLFGKISRLTGLLFSILFILFFMSMVGWTPSIMRAGVMTILNLLTWYVGRKIAPWRLILMVMAFTLIINPEYIISLAWLLSFSSFAGIMIVGPHLSKFFYGDKKPGFIGETVMTTLAATIMTLPITLYYFGQISIISVVANLLILPTLPYAMGLVFLTGVVSGIPGIETAVSFSATKLLSFHITVVEFFGSMPQFLIKIPPYQPWVFLFYAPIIIGLLWKKWYNQDKLNY